MLGIFFVPGNIYLIPNALLMGYMLYATSFIASLVNHGEFKLKEFAKCPLFVPVVLVYLSCFFIGLLDEYSGSALGIWRATLYFIKTFMLFLFGWISLNNYSNNVYHKKENDQLFSKLLPFTLVITIFGLITAVTKNNPILDAVGLENRFNVESMAGSIRGFRVSGANTSCSVYGLSCVILFMCSQYMVRHKTKIQLIATALLALNVLITATRSAIIAFIACLCIFLILEKGISKTIRYVATGCAVTFIMTLFLPSGITAYFDELFNSIVDIFFGSGGSDYGGSTVEGRNVQIWAALEFLKEKPLFGHGIGYAQEVLLGGEKHDELLGMESYICFIGIDFGLVYAVAIIIFFISCLIYFFKNRKYCSVYSNLGIAFIVSYILFLIFAWVGEAWYYMMTVLGYITKKIYIEKQRYLQVQQNEKL